MKLHLSWPVIAPDPNLRVWRIYGNQYQDRLVKGELLAEVPASETTAEVEIDEGWWRFTIAGVTRPEQETPWETCASVVEGIFSARGAGDVPSTPEEVGAGAVAEGFVRAVIRAPAPSSRAHRIQLVGGPPAGVISDPAFGHLLGEYVQLPADLQEGDAAAEQSPAFQLEGQGRTDARTLWVRPISAEGTPGTAVLRTLHSPERAHMHRFVVASIDRTAGTYSGFPAPASTDAWESSATYGFRARTLPLPGGAGWAGYGAVGGGGLWSSLKSIGVYTDNGKIRTNEIDLGASVLFQLDLYHEAHRRDGVWTTKPMGFFAGGFPAFPHEHARVRNTREGACWAWREVLTGGKPRQPLREVWWEVSTSETSPVPVTDADFQRVVPGQVLRARYFVVRLRWFEPYPWFRFATGSVHVGVLRSRLYLEGAGSPEGVTHAPKGAWYRDTTAGSAIYSKTTDSGATGWVQLAASADLAAYLKVNGSVPMTGNLQMGSQRVTGMGDPVDPQDAATKAYVDARAPVDWKASARAASTANVSVSSAPASIDGVTLANTDRVLLKDQTAPAENGLYVFNGAGSALTRATDADASAEVTAGMVVPVAEGTVNADTFWLLTTNDPITLGTTGLTFTQFGAGGVSDHGALGGLGDDDHAQYVAKDGRSGGQTVKGGTAANEHLDLEATAHATKGSVRVPRGAPSTKAAGGVWVDTPHLAFQDNEGTPATHEVRHDEEHGAWDRWILATGSTDDVYRIAGLRHAGNAAAVTPALGRIYAMPMPIGRKRTLDQLAFYLVTNAAAGGQARIGLYRNKSDTEPKPDALVLDSGAIATDTGAPVLKTYAPGSTVLTPGLYWLVLFFGTAAGTIRGVTGAAPVCQSVLPIVGFGNTFNASDQVLGWYLDQAFGALPSPFGTPTGKWTQGALGSNLYFFAGARFSA